MAEGTMSASDIALMARDHDGWGDGMGFMWIFALLILANGGFGFGGNGFANAIGYENLATSNEVQRGFDNQNSLANQREILAATNQTFHDMSAVFNDKYSELQRDIAAIAVTQQQAIANQNNCCCSIQRAIDGVNYNAAMNTASINATTTEQTQRILDALTANRMEDMQNQINQLQLDQAMQGVVRYPNGFVYNAGGNPFCGCNNGCCNV